MTKCNLSPFSDKKRRKKCKRALDINIYIYICQIIDASRFLKRLCTCICDKIACKLLFGRKHMPVILKIIRIHSFYKHFTVYWKSANERQNGAKKENSSTRELCLSS